MEVTFFSLALTIVSVPFQLMHYLIWTALDTIAFDVLQLGPYLPIQL